MNTSIVADEKLNAGELMELEDLYGAHNYHPLDVVIERAEGVWVYDTDGKRYLDCLAAYSAVNQGHCHPAILRRADRAGAEGDAVPRGRFGTISYRCFTRICTI